MWRTFSYASGITVDIMESLDPAFGMYVWPSSVLLAQFVYQEQHLLRGKRVLELGCGTALPGLLAAKLGAKFTTVTDSPLVPHVLDNCRQQVKRNALSSDVIAVQPCLWGVFDQETFTEPIDIIFAADCLFDTCVFDRFFLTLSWLMEKNTGCEAWMVYQNRSSGRSLLEYFDRWNLQYTLRTISALDETLGIPNLDSLEAIILKRR